MDKKIREQEKIVNKLKSPMSYKEQLALIKKKEKNDPVARFKQLTQDMSGVLSFNTEKFESIDQGVTEINQSLGISKLTRSILGDVEKSYDKTFNILKIVGKSFKEKLFLWEKKINSFSTTFGKSIFLLKKGFKLFNLKDKENVIIKFFKRDWEKTKQRLSGKALIRGWDFVTNVWEKSIRYMAKNIFVKGWKEISGYVSNSISEILGPMYNYFLMSKSIFGKIKEGFGLIFSKREDTIEYVDEMDEQNSNIVEDRSKTLIGIKENISVYLNRLCGNQSTGSFEKANPNYNIFIKPVIKELDNSTISADKVAEGIEEEHLKESKFNLRFGNIFKKGFLKSLLGMFVGFSDSLLIGLSKRPILKVLGISSLILTSMALLTSSASASIDNRDFETRNEKEDEKEDIIIPKKSSVVSKGIDTFNSKVSNSGKEVDNLKDKSKQTFNEYNNVKDSVINKNSSIDPFSTIKNKMDKSYNDLNKNTTKINVNKILEESFRITNVPISVINGNESNSYGSYGDIKGVGETGSASEAMNFFMSRGWTKEQSAGIVGNLQAESGPNLKTDANGDGGKAYGIAQWHADRQRIFEKIFGKPIQQAGFKEQLSFVDWELKNTERDAGMMLSSSRTPEAAYNFDYYYERSAGLHTKQRIANAEKLVGIKDEKLSKIEISSPLPVSNKSEVILNKELDIAKMEKQKRINKNNEYAKIYTKSKDNESENNTENINFSFNKSNNLLKSQSSYLSGEGFLNYYNTIG